MMTEKASVSEIEEKLKIANKIRMSLKTDYLFIQKPCNFSWLTGGVKNYVTFNAIQTECGILLGEKNQYIVTPKSEVKRLERELPSGIFDYIDFNWMSDIHTQINRISGSCTVQYDENVTVDDLFKEKRTVLNNEEVQRLKLSGSKSAEILEKRLINVKSTDTEKEICAALSRDLLKNGLEPQLIIVSGRKNSLTHHNISGNAPIGDYCMGILCVKYKGLVVSLTRLRSLKPLKELQKKAKNVRELEAAIINKTADSQTVGDVFSFLQAEYKRRGFENKWMDLHQGGVIGYNIKEEFASPDSQTSIVDNMAFAWNISLFGVKYEDTFLKRDGRMIWITRSANPKGREVSVRVRGNTYLRPSIL